MMRFGTGVGLVLVLVTTIAIGGCFPGTSSIAPDSGRGEKVCARAKDCAHPQVSLCGQCPSETTASCENGSCFFFTASDGGTTAFDVVLTADVSFHYRLANQVMSFVHVVALSALPTGEQASCDNVIDGTELRSDLNVLRANYKNLSGGALVKDFFLGRAPAHSRVVVVILAYGERSAKGSPIGLGCSDVTTDEAGEKRVDVISVRSL